MACTSTMNSFSQESTPTPPSSRASTPNSRSRASTPNSRSRTFTPYSRDRTPTTRPRTPTPHSRAPTPYSHASTPYFRAATPYSRAATPYSRARTPYLLNHEGLASEELTQLTHQLGQARATSDTMLGHLIEQVDVAKAALQAATIDVSEREASYRTEIEALKDKLSCLDGGDVQRFEEMAATISDLQGANADLQSTYDVLLKMHTGVCVDSQRISNAHEDLKDRFATVTANHEELQRTCHVLENLRDHLAEDTSAKDAAFQALVDFVRCTVCDTLMMEPCVLACGHMLCVNCVDRWAATGGSCPFCRVPMEPRVIVGLKDVVEKVVAVQVPGSSRVNPIEIV
ncbi:hypothetical protein BDN71DRAFT_1509899 [Pleurotus eryngii]|uniref:RING-type domain-containing protein n=1 Tax=Pleurotus eryngii TaxID=5323 RepID=A0A9P6DE17_PLEER|nr:hypothetical protein BDN71DRAFT_1509899 [Pleurotus eryngii]